MREILKNGTKVKFKDPSKYDNYEHSILNSQKTGNDICYFLHYWSWTDEDELILVEDKNMNKVNVGDYFDDGTLSKIVRIEGDNAYYNDNSSVPIDYAYKHRLSISQELAITPSHYNGTEVFDQMILLYGLEAVKGFCICNAYKYRQRAGKKSDKIEEDIKKAIWYELKLKELNNVK